MKILVIDDERMIVETVENRLRREGHSVFTAESAEEGIGLFRVTKPDLILLDVMLPGRSGFDLARQLRKDSSVPIIFLTARAGEDDRVQGLELGGDDYVVKPFSLAELVARVKSVLRRSASEAPVEVLTFDDVTIDPRTHEVIVRGKAVGTSPKEFALLHFLARNAGQLFSREALLDRVWGPDAYVNARTVDVHIRWLREKLEMESASPKHIMTVRGVGYKFVG